MLSGDCRRLLAADEQVLHEKEFDAGSQESRDRLTRTVDDRLPFYRAAGANECVGGQTER